MIVLLNVASTWLTLSHVQDVLVFKLGLESKNLNREFFLIAFLSPSRQMPRWYLRLLHHHLLPSSLQFIIY